MIFQEIKEMLEKRQYAEIDTKIYQSFLDTIYTALKGQWYGDGFPQDYFDLQKYVYERVAKDIIYQDTGYINDHFCLGVLYGMLRVCDDQQDINDWYDIYSKVLNKE